MTLNEKNAIFRSYLKICKDTIERYMSASEVENYAVRPLIEQHNKILDCQYSLIDLSISHVQTITRMTHLFIEARRAETSEPARAFAHILIQLYKDMAQLSLMPVK